MSAFDEAFNEIEAPDPNEAPEEQFEFEGAPPVEEPVEQQQPVYTSIDDLLSPPEEQPPAEPVPPTPVVPPKPALRESFDLGHEQEQPVPSDEESPQVKKLKAEFMRKLTSEDPTEAFIFAAQVGAQAAEQRLNERLGAIQGNVLQDAVEKFRTKVAAENPKLFKAVVSDFNSQIQKAEEELRSRPGGVNVTPAQVFEACEAFYDRAKGRALDRILAKSNAPASTAAPGVAAPERQVAPPNYAAPTGPARKAPAYVPKTAQEKEAIELARAAGLNDDDIRDMFS